jgi:hypothetical protein
MTLLFVLVGLARADGCDAAYRERVDRAAGPALIDLSGAVLGGYLGVAALAPSSAAEGQDAAMVLALAGVLAGGTTMGGSAALDLVTTSRLKRARRLLSDARLGSGLAVLDLSTRLQADGVAAASPEAVAAALVAGDAAGVFCPGGIPAPPEDLEAWVRTRLRPPASDAAEGGAP